MNDRELLQIALDALHKSVKVSWNENLTKECFNPAIEIIQARLAQPQREWQTLTDEEIEKLYLGSFDEGQFARAIEAKLKEKNYGRV